MRLKREILYCNPKFDQPCPDRGKNRRCRWRDTCIQQTRKKQKIEVSGGSAEEESSKANLVEELASHSLRHGESGELSREPDQKYKCPRCRMEGQFDVGGTFFCKKCGYFEER